MRRLVSAPDTTALIAPQWNEYESLARTALDMLCAGDSEDCASLLAQNRGWAFDELDYTGAGFFLRVSPPEGAPRTSRSGIIGDVNFERPETAEDPLGCLLFVEDGLARTLEVFAYANWPSDVAPYECHYIVWRPHNGGLVADKTPTRDNASMWR